MNNPRTRPRASIGVQPLGRFLADLNWTNSVRLITGSVPLPPGGLALSRFLGLVNWRGDSESPPWPTADEPARETIDQSSLVESVFGQIAWD